MASKPLYRSNKIQNGSGKTSDILNIPIFQSKNNNLDKNDGIRLNSSTLLGKLPYSNVDFFFLERELRYRKQKHAIKFQNNIVGQKLFNVGKENTMPVNPTTSAGKEMAQIVTKTNNHAEKNRIKNSKKKIYINSLEEKYKHIMKIRATTLLIIIGVIMFMCCVLFILTIKSKVWCGSRDRDGRSDRKKT